MLIGGLVGAAPQILLAAFPWIRPALLPLIVIGGGVLLIIEFLGELPSETTPTPPRSTAAELEAAQGRTLGGQLPQQEEKVQHAPTHVSMIASYRTSAMANLTACVTKLRLHWVDKIKPRLNQCKSNVHAFFSRMRLSLWTELFAPLTTSIVFGGHFAFASRAFHAIRGVGQGFKIEKERNKFFATTGRYVLIFVIFAMSCQMVVWYATLDVAAQATRAPQYALADPISKYAPFSSSDAEIDWPHTQEDVSHDETVQKCLLEIQGQKPSSGPGAAPARSCT